MNSARRLWTRVALALLASLVLVPTIIVATPQVAQATNCNGDTFPHSGTLTSINIPGTDQYTAAMQFTMTADELCSLQQAAPYLEIKFGPVGLGDLIGSAGGDSYTVASNLPGAIHDTAFLDQPGQQHYLAVTHIITASIVAGVSYYATISWEAGTNAGAAPGIFYRWVPSRWANPSNAYETGSCATGYVLNNLAYCIFGIDPITVTLFGNNAPFKTGYTRGVLPLDGFRWFTWGTFTSPGTVVQGLGNPVTVPVAPLPPTPGRTVLINGGGMAFAGPGTTNWTQLTQNNDALRVVAGENRVGLINGCRALFVTDNLTNWTQIAPCNGALDVAIGSSGRVVFTNGGGATYASDNLLNWTQLTPANGTEHIAVGGSRVGVINSCGSLNVTDNLVKWTQITPCNGALSVAIGSSGRTAFINGCGSAYTSDNLVSWTQITPCNGALMVAVGGSRVVFTNSGGETYASDNVMDWVRLTPPNGTMNIAAGKSGRVAVTNGCGSTNITDDLVNWTQITGCNDTEGIALG
jgi:hypothetical protein